jgi:hypothetical protein
MNWTKKDLNKLKGKVKSIDIPPEPKNGVKIPKSIGKYKLHIISVLEKSGLDFKSEFRFDEKRKFRFDWAIPELKIACEYEGIFSDKSGHTTISGFSKDVEKYNLAAAQGWTVLRYTAINYLDVEEDLKKLIS